MAGSNVGSQAATFGTRGVPGAANSPGGRAEPATWTDSAGSLWLFGGANGTVGGFVNDLWRYVPSQRELYLPMLRR